LAVKALKDVARIPGEETRPTTATMPASSMTANQRIRGAREIRGQLTHDEIEDGVARVRKRLFGVAVVRAAAPTVGITPHRG